jgi:hypothetical protein
VPFERFRSARARPSAMSSDQFADASIVDPTTPVFDEVGPLSDRVNEIPTARH